MFGEPPSRSEIPGSFFSVAPQGKPPVFDRKDERFCDRLWAVTTGEARHTADVLQKVLRLGTTRFGVENGHLTRIDPADGTQTIVEVSGSHPVISKGDVVDLASTYCRAVVAEGKALAVVNASEQGWARDAAYEAYGFSTYLGAKVIVGGELYGTVCFVAKAPRTEPFSREEAACLELISRTLGEQIERERHKDRLGRTAAEREALFDGSPDMIYVHDAEGTFLAVNGQLREQTGYDEKELDEMKVWDLDRSRGPDTAREQWASMKPGGDRRLEGRYQCRDGSTIPVEVHVRRLDLMGKERFVAIGRDISERREWERVLQDRQIKVEALYTATCQLLQSEEEEEIATLILKLVNEVFGYPLVAVRLAKDGDLVPVGLSPEISDHMPDRPSFDVEGDSVVAEAYRKGRTVILEDLRDAGDPFDYGEARATAIVPIEGHGTISVADVEVGAITAFDCRLIEILSTYAAGVVERLGWEEELREAKAEAEKAARLKTAMLANINHELRTPLTPIKGFSEILAENLTGPNARLAKRMRKSSQRLLDTLDSVLCLSKLEAGPNDLDRERLDLKEPVEKTVALFQPKARKKRIDLRALLPDGPVEGHWNESALRHIAENLIENAIKFTPEAGTVEVRIRTEQKSAVLAVEDTGIGIAEEAVSEVFEAFRQESEGRARSFEGTGLGLSIVCRLVEGLGGSIDVETERGEGSCFTVHLPRASGATDEQG